MAGSTILELKSVNKYFGDFAAVERVSLSIAEGEFFTIVGPSGSGKTTLIRMLVGMDKPTHGDILLRGERINDKPAHMRPTCMVFQSLALFPHMTVGENVEYPLKCRGTDKAERRRRAEECLGLAHLSTDYYERPVAKCSGGERQRVALARALCFDPEILFFDEPLSAIDYKLRKMLEKEIKDIQRETGKTFVYITHSLEEAMIMSDRIGVMRDGRLVQVGSPREIYKAPESRFVSEFMGEVNILPVTPADGKLMCEPLGLAFDPPPGEAIRAGSLIVRPEDMRFVNGKHPPNTVIQGEIFNEYLLGSRVQYQVRAKGVTLLVERLRDADTPDRNIELSFAPEDSMLFSE
ncbi:MAG: ABC transporter ATP-binding protein [Pseudomonadota bacterium]